MRQSVGVDFGTSTTLIAEGAAAGRPAIVPIGRTTSWMPSIATAANSGIEVAEDALRRNPGSIISSAKRCITRREEFIVSPDGSVELAADDVIVAILAELAARSRMERLPLSEEGVTRLGCPAMWDANQRMRLLGLAEKAGFRVGPATLIDEPISAGLHWINEQSSRGEYLDQDRVLVFDMGGGTLDVALLDVTTGPGREPEIYVLASEGMDEAGDAIDAVVADELEAKLQERGIYLEDLPDPLVARAYLVRAAREAKEALSDAQEIDVHVGYQVAALPALHYSVEELESAVRPQLERAWQLVLSTLRAAHLTRRGGSVPSALRRLSDAELTKGVTHVLLAGGMSRTRGVAKYLGERVPRAQLHEFANHGGQEAIAAGLADTTSFEQVNLHRPAFDFVLEYESSSGDVRTVPLYRAHTRFYASWEPASRDRLFYEWPRGATAADPQLARTLPRSGRGSLSVIAMDGTRVPLRHQGQDYDSLEVTFGHSEVRFVLSPEGTMKLKDGAGKEHSLRIKRWPALGSGFSGLALPVEEPVWEPMRQPWWQTK